MLRPIQSVSRLFLIHFVCIWNRNSHCHPDSTAGFGSIVRFADAKYFSPPSPTRSRFQRKSTAFITGPDSRFRPSSGGEDGVLRSQRQRNDESDLRVDTIKNDQILSPTDEGKNIPLNDAFDKVVNARFACPRFQRYREPPLTSSNETSKSPTHANSIPTASVSNPLTVQAAYHCLNLSQRSPTGFNTQPYRIVLVHSCEQKAALSQYCLARNADRVRDSDCTAVFLSDGECGRDWSRFRNFLLGDIDTDASSSLDGTPDEPTVSQATATTGKLIKSSSRARRPLSPEELKKMRIFILLFSSGYPIPRIASRPFSFFVRLGMAVLASFFRTLHTLRHKLSQSSSATLQWIYKLFPRKSLLLPTLSSPETWSQKNTMLVAMTYMLACTSRGLATCPMEGIDAQGIRSVLGIPRRFGIPLIVSTGTPYRDEDGDGLDDAAASHGDGGMSPRYPMEEVVFGNSFGCPLVCPS
ncbi:hypothetical protein ACHAW6_012576 [Cyclotella cf. meneghiniana]